MPADAAPAADILRLFPPGSKVDPDGELVVGGCRLAGLAATRGTPLFIIDEDLDDRGRGYLGGRPRPGRMGGMGGMP